MTTSPKKNSEALVENIDQASDKSEVKNEQKETELNKPKLVMSPLSSTSPKKSPSKKDSKDESIQKSIDEKEMKDAKTKLAAEDELKKQLDAMLRELDGEIKKMKDKKPHQDVEGFVVKLEELQKGLLDDVQKQVEEDKASFSKIMKSAAMKVAQETTKMLKVLNDPINNDESAMKAAVKAYRSNCSQTSLLSKLFRGVLAVCVAALAFVAGFIVGAGLSLGAAVTTGAVFAGAAGTATYVATRGFFKPQFERKTNVVADQALDSIQHVARRPGQGS